MSGPFMLSQGCVRDVPGPAVWASEWKLSSVFPRWNRQLNCKSFRNKNSSKIDNSLYALNQFTVSRTFLLGWSNKKYFKARKIGLTWCEWPTRCSRRTRLCILRACTCASASSCGPWPREPGIRFSSGIFSRKTYTCKIDRPVDHQNPVRPDPLRRESEFSDVLWEMLVVWIFFRSPRSCTCSSSRASPRCAPSTAPRCQTASWKKGRLFLIKTMFTQLKKNSPQLYGGWPKYTSVHFCN